MKPSTSVACILLFLILLPSCTAATRQIPPPPANTQTSPSNNTLEPTTQAVARQAPADAYPVTDFGYPIAYPSETPLYHPESGYPPDVATQKAMPTFTPYPTATPTITPTPGPPTITPIVGRPTATLSLNTCPFEQLMGDVRTYPAPDLSNAHWEPIERDGLTGQRLAGISAEIGQADASPYGTGVAVASPRRIFHGHGGWDFSLIVTGGPGLQPWLAVESYNEYYYSYQWLPNNRIIWADQGKLYTAKADGSEKVHLPVQDDVIEVWSNGTYAIASGEYFWRVNLTSRISQKIEDISSSSHINFNAQLSPDQSELLVNHGGTLLQIPLAPTGPVTRYKTLGFPGRGGRIHIPFTVGTKYLHPGDIAVTVKEDYVAVFQRGNLEPIPLKTLIPLGDEYRISDIRTSPDGKWIDIAVYENKPDVTENMQQQVGVYLAPADDMANGQLVPGAHHVTEWRTEPPAAFLVGRRAIVQVSLPSYDMREIANIDLWESQARNNITLLQGDGFFALFSPEGLLLSTHDLQEGHRPERVFLGYNGELYITGNQFWNKGNNCHVTSWLDVLQLP